MRNLWYNDDGENIKLITKIIIKNIASYNSNGVEIEELTKLNYFFGNNGCGKSTIERWETSKEVVKGPVVLLLQMLEQYPDYPKQLQIPQKEYPLRLWYMYQQKPCTLIDINEIEQKIHIINYTDNLMFRAFGKVENPDYEMYEEFLESRCFPACGQD